jgi:hypothetical protein
MAGTPGHYQSPDSFAQRVLPLLVYSEILTVRVHGNWVDGDVLGTTKELIDMAGVPITPYGALPKPNSHAVSIVGAEAAGVAAGRGGAPAINGAVNGHDA